MQGDRPWSFLWSQQDVQGVRWGGGELFVPIARSVRQQLIMFFWNAFVWLIDCFVVCARNSEVFSSARRQAANRFLFLLRHSQSHYLSSFQYNGCRYSKLSNVCNNLQICLGRYRLFYSQPIQHVRNCRTCTTICTVVDTANHFRQQCR